MKKMCQNALGLVLSLGLLFCLTACGGGETTGSLWEGATYTEDTKLGDGSTEFTFAVTAEEKTVTVTVATDETVLGDALQELELIAGEEQAFGLYVKEVNGIRADYDLDKAYWALTVGGETAMSGVDGIEIVAGEVYGMVYTKG